MGRGTADILLYGDHVADGSSIHSPVLVELGKQLRRARGLMLAGEDVWLRQRLTPSFKKEYTEAEFPFAIESVVHETIMQFTEGSLINVISDCDPERWRRLFPGVRVERWESTFLPTLQKSLLVYDLTSSPGKGLPGHLNEGVRNLSDGCDQVLVLDTAPQLFSRGELEPSRLLRHRNLREVALPEYLPSG